MIGKKFGRLKIVKLMTPRGGVVRCECECGKEITVPFRAIRSGNTKSCGCLKNEGNNLRHGFGRAKKESREYVCWKNMKSRCYNKNNVFYKNYGGRGIEVCDEWINDFSAFISDMGAQPSNRHTIEREDVNLGYSPENCRWATYKEQGRNRRNNRVFLIDGKPMILSEVAEMFGFSPRTIIYRLHQGKTIKEALSMPHPGKQILKRYKEIFGNKKPSEVSIPKFDATLLATIQDTRK